MNIDTEKMQKVAKKLAKDVSGIYSKAGVTIGCVDGVWFRLEALDDKEAEDVGSDTLLVQNECIHP